jgi:hypothetical protein
VGAVTSDFVGSSAGFTSAAGVDADADADADSSAVTCWSFGRKKLKPSIRCACPSRSKSARRAATVSVLVTVFAWNDFRWPVNSEYAFALSDVFSWLRYAVARARLSLAEDETAVADTGAVFGENVPGVRLEAAGVAAAVE